MGGTFAGTHKDFIEWVIREDYSQQVKKNDWARLRNQLLLVDGRGGEMAGRDIEQFASGATRNASEEKPDYEGFISPEVLVAFGEYMHEHRYQRDGSVRTSDNWQEGIPLDNYMKSLVRHVTELWYMHRTGKALINLDSGKPFTKVELCCAIMFNVMGYLKERISPSPINYPEKDKANQYDPRPERGLGGRHSRGIPDADRDGIAVPPSEPAPCSCNVPESVPIRRGKFYAGGPHSADMDARRQEAPAEVSGMGLKQGEAASGGIRMRSMRTTGGF